MPKRLAILGVFVAAWYIGAQVPSQGEKKQNHPAHNEASSDNLSPTLAEPTLDLRITIDHKNDGKGTHRAVQEQSHNWEEAFWPVPLSNWALVIVGGIAGFLAWRTLLRIRRQTDLMNRNNAVALASAKAAEESAKAANAQIKMMKARERARIMVTVSRLDTLTFGIMAGNQIEMRFENIGPTHAQNVTASGTTRLEIKDFDPSDLEEYDPGPQDLAPQDVIRANQPPVETYLIFFIPEKWGDDLAIMDRRILIEMRGSVEYEDIFGDRHSTPFNYDLRIPKISKWRSSRVAEVHPFSHWSPSKGPDVNLAT